MSGDMHARVARMLENGFHRNQSAKASRWNNERRSNAEGAKLNPHVERVPLPRNVSPAPPLPDWREKLAALEIEGNDAEMTDTDTEEYEGTYRPQRDIGIEYTGDQRWKTPEAARYYQEQATVRFGRFYWLMSDDEVADLGAKAMAYLAERGTPDLRWIRDRGAEPDDLTEAIQHLQALVSDHGEAIPADILKAISDLDWS